MNTKVFRIILCGFLNDNERSTQQSDAQCANSQLARIKLLNAAKKR